MRRFAIAGSLVLGFAAAAQAEMLPGSEWEPVELDGETFTPVSEIFVRFEQDGRFFGNDGCNSLLGQYVTNSDAILFGPAAATMMACPEEIMAQSRLFAEALMAARNFKRDGTELSLVSAEGNQIMRLRQRDTD